jgi:predicted metal-dependent hydrolase
VTDSTGHSFWQLYATELDTAAQLFNQHDFFICHEILEDIWRSLCKEHPYRLFLQGWIQIAVGFHHWGNHNRTGAVNLLKAGLSKMRPSPELVDNNPYNWTAFIIQSQEQLERLLKWQNSENLPDRQPPHLSILSI